MGQVVHRSRSPNRPHLQLAEPDKKDALHACLIVCVLTSVNIVPRVFQLQASIATLVELVIPSSLQGQESPDAERRTVS